MNDEKWVIRRVWGFIMLGPEQWVWQVYHSSLPAAFAHRVWCPTFTDAIAYVDARIQAEEPSA